MSEARPPYRIDTRRTLVMVTTDQSVDGLCCVFFDGDTDAPRLLAKAACSRAGTAVFEREFVTLQHLERVGMNRERRTTPAPLGLWRADGIVLTLQSAFAGTLMKNLPGKTLFAAKHITANLAVVSRWLQHLQETCGIQKVTVTDALYTQMILRPIQLFRQRFLMMPSEWRYLAQRYDEARGLLGTEIPCMVMHGDLCTANIMWQPDGIGVFDWEFPLAHHLPLFDLFLFFASVRFPYTGYRGESSHFDSFLSVDWGENYFNTAMRACIRQTCIRLDIPFEVVPDLFMLALIRIANMKYDAFLEAHNMEEDRQPDEPVDDAEKKRRWQVFQRTEKDVPFACIRDGVCENIRFVIQHGLPRLTEL